VTKVNFDAIPVTQIGAPPRIEAYLREVVESVVDVVLRFSSAAIAT